MCFYVFLASFIFFSSLFCILDGNKNAASNIEQVLGTSPHKAATVRSPTTHQENYQS